MQVPESVLPGDTESLPGVFVKDVEAIGLNPGLIVRAGSQPRLEISVGIAVTTSDYIDALAVIQCSAVPGGIRLVMLMALRSRSSVSSM